MLRAQAAEEPPAALQTSFDQEVRPFLEKNCVACHNDESRISGVSVEGLTAGLEDRHLRLWGAVRRNVVNGSMPPEGMPQPTPAESQRVAAWISKGLEIARARPTPKNGLIRRLTVAQYRNTLRELLQLDDDLTHLLPPDAISKDGFVNNTATLELSPLLMEAYFEIAEQALDRAIVDPTAKPSIQNFRVDLGADVNPTPLPEELILGANSMLLDNKDYRVEELTPVKSFPFEPFRMRTSYRFIEGYKGNATVRGWRDFNSIYHAVFAGMRGSRGYPKGMPFAMVPSGLLLRPAVPTDEIFQSEGTYGPKANFKISLRELPDHGRFRVTVTAAKYEDGLLLDPEDAAQPQAGSDHIVWTDPETPQTLEVEKSGVYQVDVYEAAGNEIIEPEASRLEESLAGSFGFDDGPGGDLEGDAKLVDSPFGQALSLDGDEDSLVIPRDEAFDVDDGAFTVAAWIHPKQLRSAGIVVLGSFDQMAGWRLELANNKGALRLLTTEADDESNGVVTSPAGVIRADAWQHVAAIVTRGRQEARLFVNGYPVARGEIGLANLNNRKADLHIGRVAYQQHFRGEIDDVRLYTRALDEAEIQALVEPGNSMALPPPETPQEVTLDLGGLPMTQLLEQPAFAAVRLEAGPLTVSVKRTGIHRLDRVVLTPLHEGHQVAQRLAALERRSPRVGVHFGLRRDCGHTFAPVEGPKTVSGTELERFVFEGAVSNYPSPDVEKDNVNYLAGIREIAVRSEYTDGRDMPRLRVRSVEFEGPFYETWPPRSHRAVFGDSANTDSGPAQAREVLRNFATRAYRRPVTEAELEAPVRVFERAFASGSGFHSSVKEALQVVLTSPQFLFLIESSDTPAPEPLEDYELASKLSYFLWNQAPDEATLKLAAKGMLRESLDAEVDRMVKDERFSQFASEFTSQWLSLDKFDVLEPDRERFPDLTRDARAQLRREPIRFFEYLVQENLPASNLIESDFVVANETVASYYDLGAETEAGFGFVPIVHGRPELGGVITQAAIMAGLSDGRESNPVKRGAWIARKIVAEPPDDPPPNVPDLSADDTGLTLRQRLEQHRSQSGCRQCHTKIDPWGVPFEEYDADGRLKAELPDARSDLPDGTRVGGVNDLRRYLAQDRIDQVAFSVLKHLTIYASGRNLSHNELNALKQDGLRLREGEYRMRDVLKYVVNSDIFLEK